jgi:hypothetical protein
MPDRLSTHWTALLLLFSIGLALRLVVAFYPPDIDSAGFYLERAREITKPDLWRNGPWRYWIHPPALSFIVAPVYLLGFGYKTAQALTAVISATAVPGIWLVSGAAGAGRLGSVLWVLVVCFAPAFFFSGGQVLPEVPLVAVLVWLVWAIDTNNIWMATIMAVVAALIKEEALAFSALGVLSALLIRDRKAIAKWTLPVAAAAAALTIWWVLARLELGPLRPPPGSEALIRESSFLGRQLEHPLAALKHAALVSWQCFFIVGMGAIGVLVVSFVPVRTAAAPAQWTTRHSRELAILIIAGSLLALHSFAAEATLVRYQMPAAALVLCGAAGAGFRSDSRGRILWLAGSGFCAFIALTAFARDISALRSPLSMSTKPVAVQIAAYDGWSRPADKSLWSILTWRQDNVSSVLIQDAAVLKAIEDIAVTRHLSFVDTANAKLTYQISNAMGHDIIHVGGNAADRTSALLLTDTSQENCRAVVSSVLNANLGNPSMTVTWIRDGNTNTFIIEGPVGVLDCNATAVR